MNQLAIQSCGDGMYATNRRIGGFSLAGSLEDFREIAEAILDGSGHAKAKRAAVRVHKKKKYVVLWNPDLDDEPDGNRISIREATAFANQIMEICGECR